MSRFVTADCADAFFFFSKKTPKLINSTPKILSYCSPGASGRSSFQNKDHQLQSKMVDKSQVITLYLFRSSLIGGISESVGVPV